MLENFKILRQYIEETNQSNSVNDKLKVLEKYQNDEFLNRVFYYTYNPFFQFHITVANLKKRQDLTIEKSNYTDLFQLLDDLHNCKITGHEAISNVNAFVNSFKEYEKEIHLIIDRNLETRVTTALINRIIPALIPEFDVALCEDYDKVKDNKKPKFDQEKWFASRKLDGLRAIAIVDELGDTIIYSRAGKEFKTFQVVIDEIKRLGFKNVVLDGEMCLLKPKSDAATFFYDNTFEDYDTYVDDFSGIMKEYSRKNHTIKNPRYRLFDCLTLEEFSNKIGEVQFSDRLKRLDWLKDSDSVVLKKLQQDVVKSQDEFEKLRVHAADQGWEGIILRKDVSYEGKRSKNMLKVKQFQDAEYIVEDIISEPIRIIEKEKEITEKMLSAIVISHKNCKVKVGSGFSMDQRRQFHKNPNLIIGKTITVKYFEESKNQHGEYSLRFPIVKNIFENERDV